MILKKVLYFFYISLVLPSVVIGSDGIKPIENFVSLFYCHREKALSKKLAILLINVIKSNSKLERLRL